MTTTADTKRLTDLGSKNILDLRGRRGGEYFLESTDLQLSDSHIVRLSEDSGWEIMKNSNDLLCFLTGGGGHSMRTEEHARVLHMRGADRIRKELGGDHMCVSPGAQRTVAKVFNRILLIGIVSACWKSKDDETEDKLVEMRRSNVHTELYQGLFSKALLYLVPAISRRPARYVRSVRALSGTRSLSPISPRITSEVVSDGSHRLG